MIDRTHELSVKRQAELVGISRGTAYYEPRPISDEDLTLMRRIDELHRGARQGTCRLSHATNCGVSNTRAAAMTAGSRSGFRVTTSIRDQSRVWRDQRRGLRSRAWR